MSSNLQIDLKDIVFTNPGLFFLKLELDNLSSNETGVLGLRTDVFGEETTKPTFKQSSFQVHYDTYKNSKLKISALEIDRDSLGKPQVIVIGSVEIPMEKILETVDKESHHSMKSRFVRDGKYVGEITTHFETIQTLSKQRVTSGKSSSSSVISGNIGRILLNRSMIHSEKDPLSEEELDLPATAVLEELPKSSFQGLEDAPKIQQKIISHEARDIPIVEAPMHLGLQKERSSVSSLKGIHTSFHDS
jgi:hypothetical protein